MPFRSPLTLDQLHEIGVRQQASDVLPLLWEIKRLHAIVMRAYQLEKSLGSDQEALQLVWCCVACDLRLPMSHA